MQVEGGLGAICEVQQENEYRTALRARTRRLRTLIEAK